MADREIIEPNKGDKRYARRNDGGEFTADQTDVGKSSAADQHQHSQIGQEGPGRPRRPADA